MKRRAPGVELGLPRSNYEAVGNGIRDPEFTGDSTAGRGGILRQELTATLPAITSFRDTSRCPFLILRLKLIRNNCDESLNLR